MSSPIASMIQLGQPLVAGLLVCKVRLAPQSPPKGQRIGAADAGQALGVAARGQGNRSQVPHTNESRFCGSIWMVSATPAWRRLYYLALGFSRGFLRGP